MRNPAFVALLREIEALHDAKNSDYATDHDPLSNFRRAEAFGVPAWIGILIRMSDKWSRIEQLAATGKVAKNESLRDSLIDNAVYSLLAIIALDETMAASTSPAPSAAGGSYGTEQPAVEEYGRGFRPVVGTTT